jgi:hypothetical protein
MKLNFSVLLVTLASAAVCMAKMNKPPLVPSEKGYVIQGQDWFFDFDSKKPAEFATEILTALQTRGMFYVKDPKWSAMPDFFQASRKFDNSFETLKIKDGITVGQDNHIGGRTGYASVVPQEDKKEFINLKQCMKSVHNYAGDEKGRAFMLCQQELILRWNELLGEITNSIVEVPAEYGHSAVAVNSYKKQRRSLQKLHVHTDLSILTAIYREKPHLHIKDCSMADAPSTIPEKAKYVNECKKERRVELYEGYVVIISGDLLSLWQVHENLPKKKLVQPTIHYVSSGRKEESRSITIQFGLSVKSVESFETIMNWRDNVCDKFESKWQPALT